MVENSVSLEAQVAAYRHALKDIAREADPEKMRQACIRALDDDKMRELGRAFHFVIKAAVQMANPKDSYSEREFEDLCGGVYNSVKDLPEGATIKSWLA